jgi:hypothetical protein
MAASTTRTEARVIAANEEKSFAMFYSIQIGHQIWLILDKGQAPDIEPVYFHPVQSLLIPASGLEDRQAGVFAPLYHLAQNHEGPPGS